MNCHTPSKSVRERVLERDGNKCIFCGTTESLELTNVVPVSSGGDSTIDNLITTCANCHKRIDSGHIRAFEFESFVVSLLRTSSQYKEVKQEPRLPDSDLTADIIATGNGCSLLIECKPVFAFVHKRFLDVLSVLDQYAHHAPSRKVVLATLGELTGEQVRLLKERGYEHWGPRYFADMFPDQLESLSGNFIANLIKFSIGKQTRASGGSSFQQQLMDCPPGNTYWSIYQRLIGRILEAFFVPPLEKNIIECSDEYKVNRRDFVLPNYCTSGFWEFLRHQYVADYIVVDAKNYTEKIKKKEILQIANYLKKHGTGLFAIIFSRKGASNSANITLREQWALYGKLIVVLNDDDLLAMFAASESGGMADTIIRQRIEEFRLKM